MPQYLSPAVYIEEVSSGVKPIEGVGTSTGAFVGHAERGPVGVPTAITSYGRFVTTFGSYIDDGYLAFAVKSFFDEGGTSCYVVRTWEHDGSDTQEADSTSTATPQGDLTISARSAGTWGDELTFDVTVDGSEFSLIIYESGEVVETHDALSMEPADARFVVDILDQASLSVRATTAGTTVPPATTSTLR